MYGAQTVSDYDRDYAARKAHERDSLDDAKIRAKVTAHHANQFREKFPQQIEHCVRLVGERLQLGLKKDGNSINNEEVLQLSQALNALYDIWVDVRDT